MRAPDERGELDGLTVVSVYLRGGADGLSLLVPHAHDAYHRWRPTLGIPRPDDTAHDVAARAVDLDGEHGLAPGLAPLKAAWDAGELAVVQAVGSDDETRSHFEAQDTMEHGAAQGVTYGNGWLARLLQARKRPDAPADGPLTAVAMGVRLPESVRGVAAVVLESADAYRAQATAADAGFLAGLRALHGEALCPLLSLRTAATSAFAAMERLSALPPASTTVTYPEGGLGRGLQEVARLIKADVGLRVACVDHDGWDSHFTQAQLVPGLTRTLGSGLAEFREDLGDRMERVVVVVMTEFGRRVAENVTLGTDHGRASVMFLLGGPVRGGRVVGTWPGLEESALVGPGDLRVTTDYRDVLSDVVSAMGVRPAAVFGRRDVRSLDLLR